MRNSKLSGNPKAGRRRLIVETLEDRRMLSGNTGAAFGDLSNYEGKLSRVTNSTYWMDFEGFDIAEVYNQTKNDPGWGQSFDNTFGASPDDGFLWNTDMRIGSVNRKGLCETPSNCGGNANGVINLTQQPGKLDTIVVQSNTMHQYVVQVQGAYAGEQIRVFATNDYEASSDLYVINGASRVSEGATYGSLDGLTVTNQRNSRPVTILAAPSTQLVIQYENTSAYANGATLKIGRFELGTNSPFNTPVDNTLTANSVYGTSGQGIASDGAGTLFASGYYSGSYRLSQHTINSPGNFSTGDLVLSAPGTQHFGAIDYSEGSVWLGRFGNPTNVKRYIPSNGGVTLSSSFTFDRNVDVIDAVAFHDDELFMSAWVCKVGTNRCADSGLDVDEGGYRILRYDIVGDGQAENGRVVTEFPDLGHDLIWDSSAGNGIGKTSSRFYAQGLRVVEGPDGGKRLYAMLTNSLTCNSAVHAGPNGHSEWCSAYDDARRNNNYEPLAMSGVYEFDVSNDAPVHPSRIWHIPERPENDVSNPWGTQRFGHLEGLDFIKSAPGQIDGAGIIHSGDAYGRTVRLIGLNDIFQESTVPFVPVGIGGGLALNSNSNGNDMTIAATIDLELSGSDIFEAPPLGNDNYEASVQSDSLQFSSPVAHQYDLLVRERMQPANELVESAFGDELEWAAPEYLMQVNENLAPS